MLGAGSEHWGWVPGLSAGAGSWVFSAGGWV